MTARALTSIVLAVACAPGLVAASGAGAASGGPALKAAWVEQGPVRTVSVRAITEAGVCPRMRVNGRRRAMRVRAAPDPPDYAVLTCERQIGPRATRIRVADKRLAPPTRPRRIAVVGDTGCRLAGPDESQACSDPTQWPFRQIARSIADWRPELIVHVGDYLYREQRCPPGDSGCANSPFGDNWPTWNADFFRPAARALRAAPWLFVRGNHELCSRAGEGWFRFLHPRRPPASCKDFTHPYAVRLGNMRMLVLDSANASDFEPFNPEPYVSQFAALDRMVAPRRGAWLLTHRPLWGLAATDDGASFAVTNTTLQLASDNSLPGRVRAVVSGHLHTAEVLGFAGRRAPQLVAGNGGTLLDSQITAPIVGTDAAGARIVEALARSEFGFFTLARRSPGWALAVRDVDGRPISRCRMARKSAPCGTD